jgi:hypothetical protein
MQLDSEPVLDERTPTASLACSNQHAMDRPAPVVLLTHLNQTNFIVSCLYMGFCWGRFQSYLAGS